MIQAPKSLLEKYKTSFAITSDRKKIYCKPIHIFLVNVLVMFF